MRRCLAGWMLAPAPPNAADPRRRTSTKTRCHRGNPLRDQIDFAAAPPRRSIVRSSKRRPAASRWASAQSSASLPCCRVVRAAVAASAVFRRNPIERLFRFCLARCQRGRIGPALSAGRPVCGGHTHRQSGRYQLARLARAAACRLHCLRRHRHTRVCCAATASKKMARNCLRCISTTNRKVRKRCWRACSRASGWPT